MTWTLPSGKPWLSTARVPAGYLLRFHGWADFTVDPAGRSIVCHPGADVPAETLRHLLLDQVLPLVLTLHKRQTLHATAVLTSRGACAFLGAAGVGKSTLAASFLTAGYPVLSDDCLVLDESQGRFLALPAYPGLRLWDDSLEAVCGGREDSSSVAHYSSKRRLVLGVPSSAFPAEPQPLAGLYVLVRPDKASGHTTAAPRIERLRGREAFMDLLSSSYRLAVSDRAALAWEFDFLDRLAAAVPVSRLHLPDCFSALPEAREAVLADLRT
ncbi:hypothetical protein [Nitrospira sp. Kam-Ns4a]